jgi:uncharacterized protein (TIRG00374 family)
VAVFFVGLWVRTWRWHYMLRPLKPVPQTTLFPLVCIGYFGNNVFPFRAGEVLRSYLLKRKEEIAFVSSFTTVFIERIFDGLTMLLFVFLALPFVPSIPPLYRQMVTLLTVALLIVTAVFMWMAVRPARVARFYDWFARHLLPSRLRPIVDDFYARFIDGLQSLSSGVDVIMIFFTSIIIWLLETVKYWFVMHSFENFQVSFFALMLMNGVVNLATTLPSAPGYVGTFDEPGIEVLKLYGINENLAGAYTLVLHAALWLPITLLGIVFMVREGLGWSAFSQAVKLAEAETG